MVVKVVLSCELRGQLLFLSCRLRASSVTSRRLVVGKDRSYGQASSSSWVARRHVEYIYRSFVRGATKKAHCPAARACRDRAAGTSDPQRNTGATTTLGHRDKSSYTYTAVMVFVGRDVVDLSGNQSQGYLTVRSISWTFLGMGWRYCGQIELYSLRILEHIPP